MTTAALKRRLLALEAAQDRAEPESTPDTFYGKLLILGFRADPPLKGETMEGYLSRLPGQTLIDVLKEGGRW